MKALVIDPGHGSLWLDDAYWDGDRIVGTAWDDSGRGSALLPDDYSGEPLTMNFPRSCVLRIEEPDALGETR